MTSAFHVYFGNEALAAPPRVRQIGPHDCFSALREGFDDFLAMPTYPAFVGSSTRWSGSRSSRCLHSQARCSSFFRLLRALR